MPQIGEIRTAKELERKGSFKYIWVACEFCGKERWIALLKGRPKSKRCCSCANREIGFRRVGEKHPQWKGGRVINTQGYVILRMLDPSLEYFDMSVNGFILEHRYIMAKHLGRCLQPWEIVHHKGIRYDGIRNKQDNQLDNLELACGLGEHSANHAKGYKDGYKKGYNDGANQRIKQLLLEVSSLKEQVIK